MSIAPEYAYERLAGRGPLGSLEHIEACAQLAAVSSIDSVESLQGFLITNHLPESLAYFIFNYQTRETRRFFTPERTAIIDTRGLTGYEPGWPVFQAEYHYEPLRDNNYLSIYSRPFPREKPERNPAYHIRIPLTEALELDPNNNLQATAYRGDSSNPIERRTFRTIAAEDELYKKERDPSTFVNVLRETADGLRKYLYLRDYL
jgi:hypothetical protein